jgi:Domain of unknown function (DUF397)
MTTWRKSSYSGSQTDCIEVGIAWRKPSFGGNSGDAGAVRGRVLVRDTQQHGNGPVVSISPENWRRFTASVRVNTAVR